MNKKDEDKVFEYRPFLLQDRRNNSKVITDRRPSLNFDVSDITHIVIVPLH